MILGCLLIVKCILGIASDVGAIKPTSAFGVAGLLCCESGIPTRAKKCFDKRIWYFHALANVRWREMIHKKNWQ